MNELGRHFIIILISSIDRAIHFSRVHSSFVAGISRRLLGPARSLRRLTSTLRRSSSGGTTVRKGAMGLHRSYTHVRRVISNLLLLVGTRRPVLPATDGHVGIVRRIGAIINTRHSVTRQHNVSVRVSNSRSLSVGKRNRRVRTTITGLLRGTVTCSPSNGNVAMSIGPGRSNAGILLDILSHNYNVTRGRRDHVFRQFCHNNGRGKCSRRNVNLNLTVIGRITLARRNSTSI